MNPRRIFFDTNQIVIDGYPASFVAGSLAASTDGTNVTIYNKDDGYDLVVLPWQQVSDVSGSANVFASLSAVMFYLATVFSSRRPVGDQVSSQISIASLGQTVIPLQQPPQSLLTARLVVNGAEYRPPDIGVSSTSITWQNASFLLEPSDTVYAVYA